MEGDREEQCFTKIYKEKFKAFQLRKKNLCIQLSLDTDVHNRQQLETTHIFTKLSFRG